MAEYNNVIKEFKRMCRYYNGKKDDCPLYCRGHGCNISHCRMLAFDDKKFANMVMKWAGEHSEPVYPRWVDWLVQKGVLGCETRQGHDFHFVEPAMFKPIPAEIAQAHGIEPINQAKIIFDAINNNMGDGDG